MNKLFVLIFALFVLLGCEDDFSWRGGSDSIAFSTDTVQMDTVFCGAVSSTVSAMIYNRSGEDMTIDRISLVGGSESVFNVNINGANATSLSDIRIGEGDSLYVFVNVFPRETTDGGLMEVVDDEIRVEAGVNAWTMVLEATALNATRVSGSISEDTQWDASRYYLVDGKLSIDTGRTLTIGAGTQVFFNEGAELDVYGRLETLGTADSLVSLRSSRMEDFYSDVPGEWECVYVMLGSGSVDLNYTEIANANYGLLVDSLTTARLNGVVIRDMLYEACISYAAQTSIDNCIFYNCGRSLLAVYGGDCAVRHSTFYNYFPWVVRSTATVAVYAGEELPAMGSVEIANTVVVGNLSNEVSFEGEAIDSTNCCIRNCYVRMRSEKNVEADGRYVNCLVGSEPDFVDADGYDFHPTAESALVGAADSVVTVSLGYDFEGKARVAGAAAIGALEAAGETNGE